MKPLVSKFSFVFIITFILLTGLSSWASSSLKKATELSRNGQWEAAVTEFQKHLSENPDDGRSQANLGVALGRINHHKEAMLAFDKAMKVGYDSAQFRYYRGLSLAKLNLLEEAAQEIELALQKDSRMALADYDLGIIYSKLGKLEKARAQVDKLYKRNYKMAKKLFDQIPSKYQIKSVDKGGTLKGKVILNGPVPKARSFHLIHAPNIEYCSRMSDGKGHRIVFDFQVSEQRGMKDTVVAILGIKKGKPFPTNMKKINIHRCHTPDYVIAIKNGKDLLLENKDPIKHEIAAYEIIGAHRNQISNKSLLPHSSQVRSAFVKKTAPEFMLKCNLHPFLQTRGFFIENPYFAITNEKGEFNIQDVPPGTYEIIAWHPFIPTQRGTITIEAGKSSEINFSFNGKDARRKLYHDDTKGYRFNTWYDSFENFYGGKRVDDPVEVLQDFNNKKRYEGDLKPF